MAFANILFFLSAGADAAVIRVDVDTVAVTASVVPTCGDGVCNGTETTASCPGDCPSSPPPAPSCGDAVCNGTETCSTCAGDCGACPTFTCGRLMPIGDSTTVGIGENADESMTKFGYRDHLQTLLGAGVCDFVGSMLDPVNLTTTLDKDHNGRSGWTPSDLLNPAYGDGTDGIIKLDIRAKLPLPNPTGSLALIHLGTAAAANPTGNVVATEVGKVMDIVNFLNGWDASVKVYVALILPAKRTVAPAMPAIDDWITSFNAQLTTAVQSGQATKPNLFLVDMNAKFKANPNFETDYYSSTETIHINDVGNQKVAEAWKAAINP